MNTFTPKSPEEDPKATSMCPPRWAESLLRHALKLRDRESILGDLLEEYREERLSNLGRTCANLWYIRQIFGIAFFQAFKGSPMKRSLICLSFLTLAASPWLLFMITILHGPWPLFKIQIAELPAVSITTILYSVFPGYRLLRILVALGVVLMFSSVMEAIGLAIRYTQFEGYMLLLPAALILQLALAILTLAHMPDVSDSRVHL